MWRKKKSLSFLPPWEFQTPLSLATPRLVINLPRNWLSQWWRWTVRVGVGESCKSSRTWLSDCTRLLDRGDTGSKEWWGKCPSSRVHGGSGGAHEQWGGWAGAQVWTEETEVGREWEEKQEKVGETRVCECWAPGLIPPTYYSWKQPATLSSLNLPPVKHKGPAWPCWGLGTGPCMVTGPSLNLPPVKHKGPAWPCWGLGTGPCTGTGPRQLHQVERTSQPGGALILRWAQRSQRGFPGPDLHQDTVLPISIYSRRSPKSFPALCF